MSSPAFLELAELGGFDPAGTVTIAGCDPLIGTRYRVGDAGAAAFAATGLAAAQLHAGRTGRAQHVRVDARAAVAALRSVDYLRVDGAPPAEHRAKLSAFYPVRDGWIRLHMNFRPHREAALRVLVAAGDRAAIAAATARWDGVALEDAIAGAGGCAGFVRPAQAWAQHPQAAAVASTPVVEFEALGATAPQPLGPGARPLSGVRVLDLTRVLAGPMAARALAEHGADVLKITAEHLDDSPGSDIDTGLGKRSARLDLRRRDDLERLRALVREADVFLQSYRPGALAAYGLGPDDLAALRPGLVYVSLSAWSREGPWRERRGFDTIVQSVSGIAHETGAGGEPKLLDFQPIDYTSGALLAYGAMAALAMRVRDGGGRHVRVSLARTGQWIVDRGMLAAAAVTNLPTQLPEAVTAPFLMESDSPFGRLRHLRPVVEMAETPAHWARPAVPLGHDPAVWSDAR